ncbi:hypothetical protein KAR10_07340 [bacterium]|nr:hypothetical protein [bacterium]
MAFKLEKGKSIYFRGHRFKGPCDIPDKIKAAIDDLEKKSVVEEGAKKAKKKDGRKHTKTGGG